MAKISKKTKWILLTALICAIGLQLYKYHWPSAVVNLKGQELKVLVAKDPYHQMKGLSGRDSLAPNDAMLFVFALPDRYPFVMRDMKFPLDIVWFANGLVVDIAPRLAPDSAPEAQLTRYIPRLPANVVLELPAGWAEAHGLKIGDELRVVSE